ncbi:MAG: tRNA (N6-isopentenyl adenosine(37)-C2)-methylthiotransferase MiaB [Actinomycetota bacterium]|nr:tRNA (N6-isopentenyl adenosine(37)-C2)-methylthiotransferase MiaB [Actinomycetota bacterium]
MKKFNVTTFGCQMNEHDSERMKGMLTSLGYAEVKERDDADLILFNTCSIRENADNRFISHLGEAKRLKTEDPSRVVGVGGCWAQSVKDEVFRRFPFVDVAFGPGQIHRLAEFLNSDSITAQGYFEFEEFSGDLPSHRERQFQGWLQISQGCNCVCSYCIVPSTRGREESRDPALLVAEAERLAGEGVKELTLLGQNVNSYGRDLARDKKIRFSDLLRLIDGVDGIERLRYTSPHPKDMREDVIDAHVELASVCEHIHLPLQSGSSPILKKMRRTYTRERYMERVEMIRDRLPDCGITTDIIVGFPGETEDDFNQTLEVVEEVGYDQAFTFNYSPRRGTLAAEMDDQVAHPVKKERMTRLLEVVQRRAKERSQRFVGHSVEVLVEGPSRNDPTRLRGRSSQNKAVNFEGTALPGQLVEVEVTAATSQTLTGTERLLSRIAV